MATFSTLLLLALTLVLVGPIWARRRRHPDTVGELELDDLLDGQHEVRLLYKGIMVKETYVTKSQGSASGLVLWQVSDGRRLVQLIHVGEPQNLALRECDFTNNPSKVREFTSSFNSEMKQANSTINSEQENGEPSPFRDVRVHVLEYPSAVPTHLRAALDIRGVKAKCKAHRRMIKTQVKAYRNSTASHSQQQKQQEEVDGEEEEEEQQEQSTPRRVRRSIMHGLRFPQTKWCGPGYDSSYYHQLGGNLGADRCCRQHDLRCPYYIEAFQKKYGVVNWSITTINHCACDERFRSCLKVARSAPAAMIGNIFFNVVKTQCFVLKKEKVCKKSSWWGRCEKWGYERRAVLREPIPWV